MNPPRTFGRVARAVTLALVVLALAGLVLQAGSVPHAHTGYAAGLFNAEHDLGFLAALASGGLVPDAPIAVPLFAVALLAAVIAVAAPACAPRRHADLRAPPVR